LLFSESPSRIIISCAPTAIEAIQEIAARRQCPFAVLGETKGSRLQISVRGENSIDLSLGELESAWRTALGKKLGAEALAAGSE
jgi:phosphoribosylformylglycinamidine synthase